MRTRLTAARLGSPGVVLHRDWASRQPFNHENLASRWRDVEGEGMGERRGGWGGFRGVKAGAGMSSGRGGIWESVVVLDAAQSWIIDPRKRTPSRRRGLCSVEQAVEKTKQKKMKRKMRKSCSEKSRRKNMKGCKQRKCEKNDMLRLHMAAAVSPKFAEIETGD